MPPEPNTQDNDQTKVDPPAPSFVTEEKLAAALEPVKQAMESFTASMNAIATSRQAPVGGAPAVQDDPDPTEQEIAAEIRDEGTSKKLAKLIDNRSKRLIKEHIDPMRNTGLSALATQAKHIAKLTGGMPHYQKFQKEIDAYIGRLPLDMQANPDVYTQAHNLIVGGHLDEIVNERVEQAKRGGRDRAGTDLPGTSTGRVPSGEGDHVPTVEELFGKEQAAALSAVGRTPDEFAKSLGHKDWKTYAKFVQEQDKPEAEVQK